ncbi:MAG: ArnT family glycosyltransferase, partial [Hyphomicrobiaceae bacterium]
MAGQGRTDALQRAVAAGDLLTARLLAALADRPVRAALALTALVLALHLPGVLLLPPLDRTEVIYAQTARQLLETDGAWTAPQFQNEPKFEKPLAVLWLQGLGARASRLADDISGYRLPSVLGTILAVLFTYTGARRIYGARAALLGAALLATMLVMAVHGTLAMPETLMLAATCAAMWAMGRAYTVRDPAAIGHGNALVFWIALGSSVLVNVATVPVIAALTALMLFAWDRGEARWLKGLVSLPGIALALALAVLWPLALYLGGSLDAALAQWRTEGAHLLLGPQEMKWRVVPGLFAVFLLLGLFPAGLFLGPALVTAWRERTSPAVRFLVAWILPYLIFLELFTRKTPLYMVQAMLPPLALLLALWVVRRPAADAGSQLATTRPLAELENDPEAAVVHRRGWFRVGAFGWLLLVAGLVIALWVLPFLLKLWVSPVAVVLGLMTLVLAVATTAAMLAGHRLAAAATLVVMAVAFKNLAIHVTFAGHGP